MVWFFGHLAGSAPEEVQHVSSLLHSDHQQTAGGDPLVVTEPPWLRTLLMRVFSLRTLGSIQHGGRQETRILWQQVVCRQCGNALLGLVGVRHQEEVSFMYRQTQVDLSPQTD